MCLSRSPAWRRTNSCSTTQRLSWPLPGPATDTLCGMAGTNPRPPTSPCGGSTIKRYEENSYDGRPLRLSRSPAARFRRTNPPEPLLSCSGLPAECGSSPGTGVSSRGRSMPIGRPSAGVFGDTVISCPAAIACPNRASLRSPDPVTIDGRFQILTGLDLAPVAGSEPAGRRPEPWTDMSDQVHGAGPWPVGVRRMTATMTGRTRCAAMRASLPCCLSGPPHSRCGPQRRPLTGLVEDLTRARAVGLGDHGPVVPGAVISQPPNLFFDGFSKFALDFPES